ncbi:MAG: PstS family phosphate ABC transporter substrate-binding protein [Phycisphaerae bacterium]
MIVGGSGTMARFVEPIILDFQRAQPGVSGRFTNTGSGSVPEDLGAGYNIGLMSRQMTDAEKRRVEGRTGVKPTELVVAHDAILVLVNETNPLPGITIGELEAIYGTERRHGFEGDVMTWGDLGVTGPLAGETIVPWGILSEGHGTVESFRQLALANGPLNRDINAWRHPQTEFGSTVARNPSAVSYNMYHPIVSGSRALPVARQRGGPFVAADDETIADGSYPLTRPLYVYLHLDPADPDAVTLQFGRYLLSREGQVLVRPHAAVPISGEMAQTQMRILDEAANQPVRIAR